MDGGAWPFLVGVSKCLVYSVNERDVRLLNSGEKNYFQASQGLAPGCLEMVTRSSDPSGEESALGAFFMAVVVIIPSRGRDYLYFGLSH